jgi:hypothetical protein
LVAFRSRTHLRVPAHGALRWNFDLHQRSNRVQVLAEHVALLVRHRDHLGLGALGGLARGIPALDRGLARARRAPRGRGVAILALLIGRLLGELGGLFFRVRRVVELRSLRVGLLRELGGGGALASAHRALTFDARLTDLRQGVCALSQPG